MQAIAPMHILTPQGLADGLQVNLNDLHPVVLIGIDSHPRKVASAMGLGDWQIPMVEGWLLGVEAVWAAKISQSGTLSTTLISNPAAGIAAWTVWLDQGQVEQLQEGMFDHTLTTLGGCRWSSKDGARVVANPQAMVLMHGPLMMEGSIRAVAAIRTAGSNAKPAMLAEVLVWLGNYALENGFPFTAPKEIVDAASSSSQGYRAVNQMLLQLAGPAGLQPS